jgi:hypothetical protein
MSHVYRSFPLVYTLRIFNTIVVVVVVVVIVDGVHYATGAAV